MDQGSEVNAMHLAYAAKLAQKIDGTTLKTFGKFIAGFHIQDKLGRLACLSLPSAVQTYDL